MPEWLFRLVRLRNRLWFTVALYSALGFVAALAAAQFGHLVPGDLPLSLGSGAVDDILSIMASSMLAVTTFALASLVTAYTAVIGNAAPRAAELLVSDRAVRNSLATFVGAFIFSVVGIIALHTDYYGDQGRVILFFATVLVLALVVVAMLRWIGELSGLGQVGSVVRRLGDAAAAALRSPPFEISRHAAAPDDGPGRAAICAERPGFVQNVDVEGLEAIARDRALKVHVACLPGAFVHPRLPLLWVTGGPPDPACAAALRGKVTVGRRRTFEQDPRFAFEVLGEIAARALSPGVNDAGPAREVIFGVAGVLADWAGAEPRSDGRLEHVTVAHAPVSELLRDALEPAARDGADDVLLHRDLQSALLALACLGHEELAEAARDLSRLALDLARERLDRREDVEIAAADAARVLRSR